MKNSDLISHVAKDLLDDRQELAGGEIDFFWSDDLIALYLSEAQRILCKDAWVMEDTDSPVTRVQLKENQTDYQLDKSILFVKMARLNDTDLTLFRTEFEDNHPHMRQNFIETPWESTTPFVENPGRPLTFSTDMGTHILKIRPKPDADNAALKVQMTVVRMPLYPISTARGGDEPECPDEFHLDLCKYAAGQCLDRPTTELELRTVGQRWKKEFLELVLKAKRDRKRFIQAAPKFRYSGFTHDLVHG